jgi:hypothetical protein
VFLPPIENARDRVVGDAWRSRAVQFPSPRWTVGGRPAWNWPDIEKWAKKTGRL